MSTANTMPDSQSPPKLPELGEPKFTAGQIETNCPARLQEIGKEITEWFEEAREQTRRLDDHVIAINKLIAEAQELCDVGGYDKFRELFCPQLGKSQAYVRLAMSAGKTTLVEHRAKERERKKKSRANQRAVAANSGTVPEELRMQDAPTEAGVVEHPSTAVEQTPEPSKCPSAVAPAAAANSGTVPEKSRTQNAPTEAGVVEHPSTISTTKADLLIRGRDAIEVGDHSLDGLGGDDLSNAEPILAEFLTREELASELRRRPRPLDRREVLGMGPARTFVGRQVLYRRSTVQRWLAAQETHGRSNTAEADRSCARKLRGAL